MKEIRKVKRICDVPGCGSTDSVAITRGSGGAVCLCRRCIAELWRKLTLPPSDAGDPDAIPETEAETEAETETVPASAPAKRRCKKKNGDGDKRDVPPDDTVREKTKEVTV